MQLTVEAIRAAGQRALVYPPGYGFVYFVANPYHKDYHLGWPAVAAAEVLGCTIRDEEGVTTDDVDAVLALLEDLTKQYVYPRTYCYELHDQPKALGEILLSIADDKEQTTWQHTQRP